MPDREKPAKEGQLTASPALLTSQSTRRPPRMPRLWPTASTIHLVRQTRRWSKGDSSCWSHLREFARFSRRRRAFRSIRAVKTGHPFLRGTSGSNPPRSSAESRALRRWALPSLIRAPRLISECKPTTVRILGWPFGTCCCNDRPYPIRGTVTPPEQSSSVHARMTIEIDPQMGAAGVSTVSAWYCPQGCPS